MHRAIIEFDLSILPELLHLPAGTTAVKISLTEHFARDTIAILIEHPDLPDTPGGGEYPHATPTFCSTYDKPRIEFVNWGLCQ